jgi:hypothetical protein
MTVGVAGTINGNGVINGSISMGGTLAVGNSIGQMDINGNVTMTGSWVNEYDGVSNTIDRLDVNGLLTLTGSSLNFVDLGGGDSLDNPFYVFASYTSLVGTPSLVSGVPSGYVVSYNFDDGSGPNHIALTAVPEPSTFVLAGVGLVALGLICKRRNK